MYGKQNLSKLTKQQTKRFEQDLRYFLLTIRVKIIPDLPQQLLFNFRKKKTFLVMEEKGK